MTVQSSSTHGQANRLLAHLNSLLHEDATLHQLLPLTLESFPAASRDGTLFCKLINLLVPGMIPSKAIQEDFHAVRGHFLMLENFALVLQAARQLNCRLVNMSPMDLVKGNENLLYALLWQVMKNGMLTRSCPELAAVTPSQPALPGERRSSGMEDDLAEKSLLRWVNSSLGDPELVLCDFRQGLFDGRIYFRLLTRLFPTHIAMSEAEFMRIGSFDERATLIVELGRQILGAQCVLEARDVIKCNESMNILFLLTLCRKLSQEHGGADDRMAGGDLSAAGAADSRADAQIAELEGKLQQLRRENEQLRARLETKEPAMIDRGQLAAGSKGEGLLTKGPMEIVFPGVDGSSDESDTETDPKDSAGVSSINVTSDSDGFSESNSDESIPMAPIISSALVEKRENTRNDPGRLRLIYQYTAKLKPLLKVIYWDISTTHLLESCTHSGWIQKKGVWGARWNRRFAIVKDNFILFYEGLKSQKPTSVEKLDDAVVQWGVPLSEHQPVISVEVCSAVNPHFFYVSAEPETVEVWMGTLKTTSQWWSQQ